MSKVVGLMLLCLGLSPLYLSAPDPARQPGISTPLYSSLKACPYMVMLSVRWIILNEDALLPPPPFFLCTYE